MAEADGGLFQQLAAISDPVRGRMLHALERHELTVNELCAVFQMPQSTMSRHLKALADEGWLVARAEGPSRRYSMPGKRIAPELRRVWQVVRESVATMPAAARDEERIGAVLRERRARSKEFFSSAAEEWGRLRRELVGRRLDLMALLGLLDDGWVVGDLGCGGGQISESLASNVGRVIAVDDSSAMLETARERLRRFSNVEIRSGELERLPIDDGSLDAAVIFLALQYVAEPVAVLREAARVLRNGGRLVVSDLVEHDREEYRQRLGHQSLGFGAEQVQQWLAEAGFEGIRYQILGADPEAKGPPLFVASGRSIRDVMS